MIKIEVKSDAQKSQKLKVEKFMAILKKLFSSRADICGYFFKNYVSTIESLST